MTAKQIAAVLGTVIVAAVLFLGGRSSGYSAGREQNDLDTFKTHLASLDRRLEELERKMERWGRGQGASQ